MRLINFIGRNADAANDKAYWDLVVMTVKGLPHSQIQEILYEQGFYIPVDQIKVFEQLLDIQMDLDIGSRKNEITRMGN